MSNSRSPIMTASTAAMSSSRKRLLDERRPSPRPRRRESPRPRRRTRSCMSRCSMISSTNGSDFEVTNASVGAVGEQIVEQLDDAVVRLVLEHALGAEVVPKGRDRDAERGFVETEVGAEAVAYRWADQGFERGLVVDGDAHGGEPVHERVERVRRGGRRPCRRSRRRPPRDPRPATLRGQAGCSASSR